MILIPHRRKTNAWHSKYENMFLSEFRHEMQWRNEYSCSHQKFVHLNIFQLGSKLRYQITGDAGTVYYHDTLQATIGKNLFKVTYI